MKDSNVVRLASLRRANATTKFPRGSVRMLQFFFQCIYNCGAFRVIRDRKVILFMDSEKNAE